MGPLARAVPCEQVGCCERGTGLPLVGDYFSDAQACTAGHGLQARPAGPASRAGAGGRASGRGIGVVKDESNCWSN